MLNDLPLLIHLLFALTVVATITGFYFSTKSKIFLIIIIGWIILQSALGLNGVYQDTQVLPPKIMLFGVFPSLLFIIITFLMSRGRAFMDSINLKTLTVFHVVRIPVEIVLFLLYREKLVSVYMTFEGTNFDIISGISAPLAAYLAFRPGTINKKLLLGWNILCLLLLLNVVITAVFAIPSPFQQLAFDQPNIAVLYFPFNLLPSVIVPIVFFAHLAAIRFLIIKK